jgi:hypothetical protein
MSLAAFLALAGIALAAWGWHAVREHHAHLRLLRVFKPDTVVPPTSHDTGWHGTGHWKRGLVNVSMIAAAIVIGFCWNLSWIGTFFALVAFGTVWIVLVMLRSAGNAMRHREAREDLPATERKAA